MRAFIVCLVAAVASADPAMFYTNQFGAAVAGHHQYQPLVYSNLHHQLPLTTYNYNAQKVASPLVYSTIAQQQPMIYSNLKVKTYANDRDQEEGYAAQGQYVAENAGAVHIAKREAEPFHPIAYNAMPYAWNSAYTYNTMPYNTLPYAWNQVYQQKQPIITYSNAFVPQQQQVAMPEMQMNKVTDNALEKENTPAYAAKGEYVAENAGAVHIAKREAEPFYPTFYNNYMTGMTGSAVASPLVYRTNAASAYAASPLVYRTNAAYTTPLAYNFAGLNRQIVY